MKFKLILPVACCFVLWSNCALGGDKSAKAYFEEGTKLYESFNYDGAAEAFLKAYQLKPTWKLLFNLGQAYAAAKRYGLALEYFESYLTEAGDGISVERSQTSIAEIERLRVLVAVVDIEGPEGCVVTVDDLKRGQLPIPGGIAIPAGREVSIRVADGDIALLNESVKLRGRERIRLEAEAIGDDTEGTAADPPVAEETSEAEENLEGEAPVATPFNKGKAIGITLLSVGTSLGIAGVVTGIVTLNKQNELDGVCDENLVCEPGYDKVLDSRNRLSIATDIFLISGIATVTAGVVTLLVARKKKKDDEQLAVRPFVAPNRMGLVLEGRF